MIVTARGLARSYRPAPGGPGPPLAGLPVRRRRRRWPYVLAISLLAVIATLVILDRVAAAKTQDRIAQEIRSQGFPSQPAVAVQGFPFLTQLLSRNLETVDISAASLRAGPVTLRLTMRATSIKLNPGYGGGTIGQLSGTGLIGFPAIAQVASQAGAPGLTVSASGPHEIRLAANLGAATATATASVTPAGPGAFRIQVVSAGGLPRSLVDRISGFTVPVPPLPLGLRIQQVSVTAKGVEVHVTGSNIRFGR